MANYDYPRRGSTTYPKGRLGTRATSWDTTYSPDPVYVAKSEGYKDHVCRPVIVDADGTMRPAVIIMPQQHEQEAGGIVGQIKTVVEHVRTPSATVHTHSSAAEGGWSKPVGKPLDTTTKINDFFSDIQATASGSSQTGLRSSMFQRQTPNNSYGGTSDVAAEAWSRPSDGWSKAGDGTNIHTNAWGRPIGGNRDIISNGWGKPDDGNSDVGGNVWDKPVSGSSYTSKNGWSRPGGRTYDTDTYGWSGPGGGTYDTGSDGWSRSTGGAYDDGLKGWRKTSGGTYDTTGSGWRSQTSTMIRQPNFDGPVRKYESASNHAQGKHSHVSWATPTSYEVPPSKPTSDTGADYLKEPMKPQSVTMMPQQSRFSVSSPAFPTKGTAVETIDSREAARRYGNTSVSPPTINENVPTIDSREAAKRYGGSYV